MTFSQRFEEIRTGFERPFWIANISELFERLSYYAVFAVLARYLHEGLHLDVQRASSLTGMFGGWVWFLAVGGGALADRLGFRRALSIAYLILSLAYFMIGSIGAPWFAPVRNAVPLVPLVAFVLMLPALGVALVKPCVVGTTARASKENVRSVGYSIYYTLVNVGGILGPLLAGWEEDHGSAPALFRIAAVSVVLMLVFVLLFFKEPRRSDESEKPEHRSSRQELPHGVIESSVHAFPAHLHRILGGVLAGVHRAPTLHFYLHRSERQYSTDPRGRCDRGHLFHDGDRISDQEDARVSRHCGRDADLKRLPGFC